MRFLSLTLLMAFVSAGCSSKSGPVTPVKVTDEQRQAIQAQQEKIKQQEMQNKGKPTAVPQ